MFGAIIRAAAEFAAGMLIATVLVATVAPLVTVMAPGLPNDSVLLLALQEMQTNFPLIMLLGALFGLVARGIVESRLPGV
jgi:hypothetical protein